MSQAEPRSGFGLNELLGLIDGKGGIWMDWDAHGGLGQKVDDLIAEFVSERAVLIVGFSFVGFKDLNVPKDVRVFVLTSKGESVGSPRFRHPSGSQFKKLCRQSPARRAS